MTLQLSSQQVWEAMRDSAVKVDSYPYTAGRNDYCGYGRIDVAAGERSGRGQDVARRERLTGIEDRREGFLQAVVHGA